MLQRDGFGFWRAIEELEGVEWPEPGRVARHPHTGEWRNEATALELTSLLRLRPVKRAAAVRCPTLAHLAEDDGVVPFGPTRRALERIPDLELRTLRGGHFAPFYGDGFTASGAALVAFFRTHLVGT